MDSLQTLDRTPGLPRLLLGAFALVLVACSDDRPADPAPIIASATAANAHPDFARVRPILEKRCVVCHACYDASCQLNLSTAEGVLRGASKQKVYDGTRLTAAAPTRLYIDANSVDEWRQKGFFPVLNEAAAKSAQQNLENSLLYRMLHLKQANPLPLREDGRLEDVLDLSLNREWSCPTIDEFEDYASEHRYAGMPFGLPAIDPAEMKLLQAWIEGGPAPGQAAPDLALYRDEIDRWEAFFNRDSRKGQLVARYIYEHLFLGNIYFPETGSPGYFRLVRSTTPPGEPVRRIASRRPYDDPGSERVYYRLLPVRSHIVAKTHMPYAFDAARLARFERLFFAADYAVTDLPSYAPEVATNPFIAFRQIPARQRYRFMLEHAQFTIRGFMKGAVCRGQVALNVIDDHFWVFFTSPDNEALDDFNDLLISQASNLSLPAEAQSEAEPLLNWLEFSSNQQAYLAAKTRMLNQRLFSERPLDETYLWNGDGANPNAALTVFRHFDSASVRRGLLGTPPKTAWVIDYPILERIHYLLVAGFDVYGNVGHQLLTRMYMDFLRMESELNFLGLLPAEVRVETRDYWYRDADDDVRDYLQGDYARLARATDIDYRGDRHQQELYARLRDYLGELAGDERRLLPQRELVAGYAQLRRMEGIRGERASLWPETSVLLLDGKRPALFTILRHSAHSNISGLFDESLRRLPQEDVLNVFPGIVGAYPDALWRVDEERLGAFLDAARQVDDGSAYRALMKQFGVRRSDPEFWAHSDRLHRVYAADYPVEYGLLDYNRLENR